jgi:hypothetical protein
MAVLELDVYVRHVYRLSLFHLCIVIPSGFILVILTQGLIYLSQIGKNSASTSYYPKTPVQLGLAVPVPSKYTR